MPSPCRISSSAERMSSCSRALGSGRQKLNISTLSNWCTRRMPRVHQFDKVEMFSFCLPEQSAVEHELILSAEEEILQGLGIPYRVVNIAAGDLGAPAAQKFDCEAWMPGQQQYREVTSCSNCTDYQARRLDCRYRTEKGPRFVHTLNGTGIAVGRTLIAIMENYQRADGTIAVPDVLRPLMGKGLITFST